MGTCMHSSVAHGFTHDLHCPCMMNGRPNAYELAHKRCARLSTMAMLCHMCWQYMILPGAWILCAMHAASASKIMAQPGTCTGSIGVYGEVPLLAPASKEAGVNVDCVKAGKHALMTSSVTDISPDEARWLSADTDRYFAIRCTSCLVPMLLGSIFVCCRYCTCE